MKRISGILFAAFFIINLVIPVWGFSDVADEKFLSPINKLTSLKILYGYEDGTFRPDSKITRAEFVAIINRVLGVSELVSGQTAEQKFLDVPKDHWAAGDIRCGAESGLILGYGNGIFGPEDHVTYEQAFKIIYNAMGYQVLAKELGEYPSNYITLASQHGIARGLNIKFNDFATRGNISYILNQAMDIETIERVGFGTSDAFQKSGTTLLEILLKIKNSDVLEGTVIANHLTALIGETTLDKGQVAILLKSGVKMNYLVGDTQASDLIGQRVEFTVEKDESNSFGKIKIISPLKNNYYEITADQYSYTIKEGSNFKIFYEINQKDSKVILDENFALLYNGSVIQAPTIEDFNFNNGKLYLIDNNQNGKYDVAIIEEYYSFLVEKVAQATSVIFLKDQTFKGIGRINLEPDETDFYYDIKNTKGDSLKLEDLSENDVITVVLDKMSKSIKITVSKDKVTGKVTEYNDEDKTAVLQGKTYQLGMDENGQTLIVPDLTKVGTYYLDENQEIVAFKEGDSLIDNVGYVLKKSTANSIFISEMSIKVLKGNNPIKETDEENDPYFTVGNKEMVVYSLKDKVIFNGASLRIEKIDALLEEGSLISFRLSSDGLISEITTLDPDASYLERAFNPEIGAFGGSFYINESTTVICVPTNADPLKDDYYTVVTLDNTITSSNKINIAGFEIDKKTKAAKIAVIKTDMESDVAGIITNNADIFIVESLKEKLNNEGEASLILEGMEDGKKVSLNVKNESRVYTEASALEKGDVIYYSKNSQGLIDNISLVYSLLPVPEYFHIDVRQKNEKIFGKLHEMKRNELSETTNTQASEFVINLGSAEDADQDLVIVLAETKTMPPVYQINSKNGKVTQITLDDLYSTAEVGYEKATELFICKKNSRVKGIIAIK